MFRNTLPITDQIAMSEDAKLAKREYKVATSKDVLDRLTAKPKRAHKHIADLEDTCDTFFDTQFSSKNPIIFKDDPNTGDRSYCVVSVPAIPLEIASMVGDILSNLRSSLDHTAYHLVEVGTGQAGPFHFITYTSRSSKMLRSTRPESSQK